MKANELMIGNLVEIKKEHKDEILSFLEFPENEYPNSNYFEIASIKKDEINILIFGDEYDFDLLDIKPTPLTEDWLLKFDFQEINGQFVNEFIVYIDIHNKFVCKILNRMKELKYVHQLQNLYFALTGHELTIK